MRKPPSKLYQKDKQRRMLCQCGITIKKGTHSPKTINGKRLVGIYK